MSSQERQPTPHFGIKMENLDDHIWRDIITVYYDVALDRPIEDWQLDSFRSGSVIEAVTEYGHQDYRLGSMLNRQSKLYVHRKSGSILAFSFYANHQVEEHEHPDSPQYQLAADIDESLKTRIDWLLLGIDIAEPLPE